MNYRNHEVVAVRKMKWDMLWHVVYVVSGRETWDRVSETEAMEVCKSRLH